VSEITPEMQAIVSVEQKRGNIEAVVETHREKLLKNSCALVRSMTKDNQDAFLNRIVSGLLDEKLAECFGSPQGKLSIFRIIEESLATGLELNKHAYAVPQSKKVGNQWIKLARYDIKRQGFHALLCGGDKPVMRDLRWGVVYEKDNCVIESNGTVKPGIAIAKTRGEVVGVWVQGEIYLSDKSTKTEANFYPIDYILDVRDRHSESWKAFKEKKISKCPWDDAEIQMYEKTAIKAFCRPWADVKDALAHAIYEDTTESIPSEFEEKSREEVTEAILDTALSEPAPESGRGTTDTEGHQPEEDIDEELNALSKDGDENEGTLF
jgi:hypothetical protein